MPIITATIEIDCPEGYEPVAYRAPNSELHVSRRDEVMEGTNEYSRLIVRPKWQPAAWMPKGAWLYERYQYWYFSLNQPIWTEGWWWGDKSVAAELLAAFYKETFVPPQTREPVQIT